MKGKKNTQGFATKAIHSGQEPDPTTGAIIGPIYTSLTVAVAAIPEEKANPCPPSSKSAIQISRALLVGFAVRE